MIGSEYLQAIFLGIVQGIAEFVPVSSSGHIVVFDALFERWLGRSAGSTENNVLLNVALHVGTLASILVVYRADLRLVLRDYRLCAWIILATIPAGLIGVLFKKRLEATFNSPLLVACGWLVTAAVLTFGQRIGRNQRDLSTMSARDALVVGLFQAGALVLRGLSRSGSTIAGGLWMGFNRESAAKFSFLIAIPATGGAAAVEIGPLLWQALWGDGMSERLAQLSRDDVGAMIVGGFVSFFVGLVVLRWLIRYIVRHGVKVFVIYCVAIALLTLAWQAWERFGGPA
jgi:undecaprenyl-diphosphatase